MSSFLGVQLAIAQARSEMQRAGIRDEIGIIIELAEIDWKSFLLSAEVTQRFAGRSLDMDATEVKLLGAIVRMQAPKRITYDWHRYPPLIIDETVPPGELHARDSDGKLVGKIINLKTE